MEKAKNKILVFCPDHEDQLLSRVNPGPSEAKHVHCLECLMQTEEGKAQYSKFPKILDFITTTAATFAEQKDQINPTSEVPKEFLEVIAGQAESLEKLSKHLDEEKKKVETLFANISNAIIDVLDELKNEHLEMLDKQVTNLHEVYTAFEKMLKRCYPKKEDIEMMFPTKEDLERRLEKIGSAADLNDFFKELKQSIGLDQNDILFINSSDEMRLKYFREFSNKLKDIKPTFEKGPNFEETKNKIKEHFHQFLGFEKIFALENPIPTDLVKLNSQSNIIASKDFEILKEWIPNDYNFNPTLLYRLTRDGKCSQTFHSLCDKKGPTITLIRCKYDGASQASIIGGFSDVDFDQDRMKWTSSNQAFIFSLNKNDKIKCPILKPEWAFYNGSPHDIWFGNSGTIGIQNDFRLCQSHMYSLAISYENSFKIIPPESYKGLDQEYNFQIEEVEVYTVNRFN